MGKSKSKNLPKNKIILLILFLFLFIISAYLLINRKNTLPSEIKVTISDYKYYLEVADTSKERQVGLSNRQNICVNCGMLFIFPKEGTYSFWMKDTHIPLDIIWLDKEFKIVKISTALETNSENRYTNQDKAKYVIELNANEVFKRDLKVGDIVQIPDLNEK